MMKNIGLLLITLLLFTTNILAQNFGSTDLKLGKVKANTSSFFEAESQIYLYAPNDISMSKMSADLGVDQGEEGKKMRNTGISLVAIGGATGAVGFMLVLATSVNYTKVARRKTGMAMVPLGIFSAVGGLVMLKVEKKKRETSKEPVSFQSSGTDLGLRFTF